MPKLLHVCFLLDRSGSMQSCALETIKGFNAYVKDLKNGDKPVDFFTLTQFDSQGIDIIHDGVPIEDVRQLTDKSYEPRGSTPLFDAIGKTMETMQGTAKDRNVLFVTLTDGLENASSKYDLKRIQKLIADREKDGWTFAHIGMGIMGWEAGANYLANSSSSSNNIQSNSVSNSMRSLSRATQHYASGACGQTATNFWQQGDDKKE